MAIIRRCIRVLLVLVLIAGVVLLFFGYLFLQDQPALPATGPATSQDVAATRKMVRDLRVAAHQDRGSDARLRVDEAQLNSAVLVGARFIPGLRGRVTVEAAEVRGQVSVPIPWPTGRKWLNASGRVPEFDQQFALSSVTVGATELPPALAVQVVRIGANLALGNSFGDRVMQAATAMTIMGEGLQFQIALDDVGKNGVMRSFFGSLRGQEMPGADEVEAYHQLIRAAMADGTLSQTGSFLPYLKFTLAAALERSTAETLPNAYTAALFGLTKVCGARDFAMIVGSLAFDSVDAGKTWPTSCQDVTLNGRVDSRRHFITAASLQAASNRGFSVPVGEFKELYDTISGAGGFDFTDLAANNSGIRMSDFLLAQPIAAWPGLLGRIRVENSVIIAFSDVPPIMTEEVFKARFQNVESAAYKDMLAKIEAKIDELGLYQTE